MGTPVSPRETKFPQYISRGFWKNYVSRCISLPTATIEKIIMAKVIPLLAPPNIPMAKTQVQVLYIYCSSQKLGHIIVIRPTRSCCWWTLWPWPLYLSESTSHLLTSYIRLTLNEHCIWLLNWKIYILDIYQLCPFLPINNIIIYKTLFVLLAISEIKENMNKNSAFVIL